MNMEKRMIEKVIIGVIIMEIEFVKNVEREKDGDVSEWKRDLRILMILMGILNIIKEI